MTRECHVRFCEKPSGFAGGFTHQRALVAHGALLLFIVGACRLSGQIGCMDKSKHAGKCNEGCEICCTPDYKQLYYVDCSCPCWRYKHIAKHGRCMQCGHYVKPEEFPITYKNRKC